MPATDSFATREAVIRDLKGKLNDIAINTKPMDSDIHLVALQTQTPYLQGAINLRDSSNAPEGLENKWVQTIPNHGWWVWFRFYSPAEAFFDKSWQLKDFSGWFGTTAG